MMHMPKQYNGYLSEVELTMLKMTFNMYIKVNRFNINVLPFASRGTDMPAANLGPTLPMPPGERPFFCFTARRIWGNFNNARECGNKLK